MQSHERETKPRNNTNLFNLIQMHSHLFLNVPCAQFIELDTFVIIIAEIKYKTN